MPSLRDAINADRSRLTPIDNTAQAGAGTVPPDAKLPDLLQDPNQRCPLPASYASADSIRQIGQGSDVPRYRVITPAPVAQSGGTSSSTVSVYSTGTSVSGSTVNSTLPVAVTTSLTTPVLASGQIYTTTIQLAPSAIMLSVSTGSTEARIELYGNNASQLADITRTALEAPENDTMGLCSDVVLQGNAPFSWSYLDTLFSNMDDPQGSVCYVTVTNISAAATAITVTFSYVPEQNL